MSKKEYVLKVLDKVKWLWPKEQEVRDYLLHDEEYVNYLYDQFVQAVDSILKDRVNDKTLSLTKYLDDVKVKEALSKQADQEDLDKLDQLLATL